VDGWAGVFPNAPVTSKRSESHARENPLILLVLSGLDEALAQIDVLSRIVKLSYSTIYGEQATYQES